MGQLVEYRSQHRVGIIKDRLKDVANTAFEFNTFLLVPIKAYNYKDWPEPSVKQEGMKLMAIIVFLTTQVLGS